MSKDVRHDTDEWVEVTLVTTVPIVDDEDEEEPEGCAYITFHGSHNYDSANFGPDEYCEENALPGSEFCAAHGGVDDEQERDYEPAGDYATELRTDPYRTW